MADPSPSYHESARRFDGWLRAHGLSGRVVELSDSTRTAAEAARAVGCELRQIVKSLVFRGAASGAPFLVLVAGPNRVDEAWVARYVGDALVRADPEFVREVSGFSIGGVPPAAIDAARGMGMTRRQIFWQVEAPLALPVLLAGLRIVLVQAIGLTVVAALIGAGGLGTFVFDGLGQYATDLVLLGALPAIALALTADWLLRLAASALARRYAP